MSDLAAARVQMGMSLAFHIVFAVVGIAMPVLMVVAERRWRRSGELLRDFYAFSLPGPRREWERW